MAFLEVEDLYKRFGGVLALDGANLSADLGEVHALVGANGAGKSTLMHVLSGTVRADRGEIRLDGAVVDFAVPSEAQAAGIATVFQELSLVPQLSVARNIFLGREPRGRFGFVDHGKLLRRAGELLRGYRFDLDSGAPVETLSVAQQQLVEIARALSMEARVLILDEPTASLSLNEQESLFRIIRDLRQGGLLVLYVSHRLDEIFGITDRVTVLRDGRTAGSHRTAAITEVELVREMIGHELRGGLSLPDLPDAAPSVLEVTYRTGGNESHLIVKSGEILGLAGFVGAGRTYLARALLGLGRPGDVEIRLNGVAFRPNHPAEALQAGIVYLTEDRKRDGLYARLSVVRNTTAASLGDFARAGFLLRQREESATSDIARRLRLVAASLDAPVSELSGGNQQKVVFARALLRKPVVLICDEPTRGVDVGAKEEIHELLMDLARRGVAILVISSEVSELLSITHRVAVMRDRAIVATRTSGEVSEEEVLLLASGANRNSREESA